MKTESLAKQFANTLPPVEFKPDFRDEIASVQLWTNGETRQIDVELIKYPLVELAYPIHDRESTGRFIGSLKSGPVDQADEVGKLIDVRSPEWTDWAFSLAEAHFPYRGIDPENNPFCDLLDSAHLSIRDEYPAISVVLKDFPEVHVMVRLTEQFDELIRVVTIDGPDKPFKQVKAALAENGPAWRQYIDVLLSAHFGVN